MEKFMGEFIDDIIRHRANIYFDVLECGSFQDIQLIKKRIEYLLDKDVHIDRVAHWGWTPLMLLCRHKRPCPNFPNKEIEENYYELIKFFIEKGANVNFLSRYIEDERHKPKFYEYIGYHPLAIASMHPNNETVLKILIEGGADPKALTRDGKTALEIVTNQRYLAKASEANKYDQMIEYLREFK